MFKCHDGPLIVNKGESEVSHGCRLFSFQVHKQNNNASEGQQMRKLTWEDYKRKFNHGYFKCNPLQIVYRKRIESAKFKTSQRLPDQARLISKKVWLCDLEILEIYKNKNGISQNNKRKDKWQIAGEYIKTNEQPDNHTRKPGLS